MALESASVTTPHSHYCPVNATDCDKKAFGDTVLRLILLGADLNVITGYGDASLYRLCLSVFPWARFKSTKAADVISDPTTDLPKAAWQQREGNHSMDTETFNDYLFADLVTRWAANVARARASRMGDASWSDAEASVTAADLQAALAQLEMRRRVVQGLREAGPAAPTE